MIVGAFIIIIFIGWFYIKQLALPNILSEKNTIAAQGENTQSNDSTKDKESESSLSRLDIQGTVSVKTTFLPDKSTSDELVFEVEMNTHSGDVLQYQLDKLVQLAFGTVVNTNGEFEWEPIKEDSHHLVGYLKWKGTISKDSITLQLKDIDNIPSRSFTWERDVVNLKGK